jgi:hypothetical protein
MSLGRAFVGCDSNVSEIVHASRARSVQLFDRAFFSERFFTSCQPDADA